MKTGINQIAPEQKKNGNPLYYTIYTVLRVLYTVQYKHLSSFYFRDGFMSNEGVLRRKNFSESERILKSRGYSGSDVI